MTELEKNFYSKPFKFSYSSLNKLIYSPSLFYKDYILKQREESIESYLIEGKLVHCLLFEPENLNKKFKVVPGKTPSDNLIKVLHNMSKYTDSKTLKDCEDFVILDSLKELNLYQSLKEDSKRLEKVRTQECEDYWEFLSNPNVDVVSEDILLKSQSRVDIIKTNPDVTKLVNSKTTDFALDPLQVYVEKYLECDLEGFKFGLKGYLDYYEVDDNEKIVTIYDLKTTNKTLTDFKETIEYYNYWLQASIYIKLVLENLPDEKKNYEIKFKFIVIDKYDQVYTFSVSKQTLTTWAELSQQVIEMANYHYTNNNYSLPYELLVTNFEL